MRSEAFHIDIKTLSHFNAPPHTHFGCKRMNKLRLGLFNGNISFVEFSYTRLSLTVHFHEY